MTFCSPAMGGPIRFGDMEGHLLIVRPLEYEADVETENGTQSVIYADVADLNALAPDGTQGQVYRYGTIYGRVMVPALRRQIGDLVLGRVVKGVAQGGRTPPWLLQDAMGDGAAVAFAESWLRVHPDFESGRVVPVTSNGTRPPTTPTPPPPPPVQSVPIPSVPPGTTVPALPSLPNPLAGALPPSVPTATTIKVSDLSAEVLEQLRKLGVKVE